MLFKILCCFRFQDIDISNCQYFGYTYRECINKGPAGARTRRSFGHHLLHPLILRLLVLCAPADFEAHHLLHPQIQIPSAFPAM